MTRNGRFITHVSLGAIMAASTHLQACGSHQPSGSVRGADTATLVRPSRTVARSESGSAPQESAAPEGGRVQILTPLDEVAPSRAEPAGARRSPAPQPRGTTASSAAKAPSRARVTAKALDGRTFTRAAPPARMAPPAPRSTPPLRELTVDEEASHGGATMAPPSDGYDTETYDHLEDNRFLSVGDKPLSTFSIDVDTASYSNVRRLLRAGVKPPPGAVRIEELVNYFSYDYPEPTGERPFTVLAEISSAPWSPRHRLVHIGLQGKTIRPEDAPPKNLVFLVDVSGSMNQPNKLPLLKRSMHTLVETLNGEDHVAIVVYAGASGLVLPPTPGSDQRTIDAAIESLQPGGSTNGASGITLAYEAARRFRRGESISRVILATDGDFNVGVTSQSELVRLIEQEREDGTDLTVLGFGMGNYKDSTLEKLADNGNGNYAYIDTDAEARKVLVEEANSTLVTIAKDVKIQVEFNPARVGAYRLVGYENRLLRDRDFNDDKKDAGEVGAGHSVTAIYEVVPPGEAVADTGVDELVYQRPHDRPAAAADTSELLTIKLRYKDPDAIQSKLERFAIQDTNQPLESASPAFRFSAAVAAFGMLLRESPYRGTASWQMVSSLARGALGSDPSGYRREFLELVQLASGQPAASGVQGRPTTLRPLPQRGPATRPQPAPTSEPDPMLGLPRWQGWQAVH